MWTPKAIHHFNRRLETVVALLTPSWNIHAVYKVPHVPERTLPSLVLSPWFYQGGLTGIVLWPYNSRHFLELDKIGHSAVG